MFGSITKPEVRRQGILGNPLRLDGAAFQTSPREPLPPTRRDAWISLVMDGQPALSRDVLIVEDDLLIALDLEATVISLGAASVRTAQTVAQALRMIDERMPDFAFLNIDLGPEQSFAVAERLLALAVGFVFVSGYGHDARMPVHLIGIPRLEKPYSIEMIAQALRPLKEPPA